MPEEMRSADISTLSDSDRRQLATWNSTQVEHPDVRVPELISAQSASTPDALAVVTQEATITYEKLNRHANQLAHHLRALHVRLGDVVGCCVERSVDMVVALLGTLKAGAAYLPMDPAYPPERLDFMLRDAEASVVVTRQDLVPHLSAFCARAVCLDGERALGAQSTSDPAVRLGGEDLAYVIYTSGSTGRPKGVEISHRSLSNLVFWHRQAFAVRASDRATQVASPAFDATGWELWPYLTAGASVHLPEDDARASAVLMRDWLVSQSITIAFLPTPLAESIITMEWPAPGSLRYLLTGADVLHRYPPSKLPFVLVNNFGPTETTVVATSGPVPPVTAADAATPPTIGRPIANTTIYILNSERQQVPIGEVGELFIGGAGVGRGYVNRPDLSAERFIDDPFSVQPRARMYRTGDLARFLPDGQIAFIGRADQQIKIRGYRIEPAEIERILNSHPAVRSSVVTSRDGAAGEQKLVAYVIADPTARLTATSLRQKLAVELPDYMMPSAFVALGTWPLTPNGKIDRAGLPAPEPGNMLRDEGRTEPTTVTEQRLAELVSSLLAGGEVGIDDNFFLIGGNSLMGTQLIVRIAEVFGVNISLRNLFEMPMVRQLAAEVERLLTAKVEAMSDDEIVRLLG